MERKRNPREGSSGQGRRKGPNREREMERERQSGSSVSHISRMKTSNTPVPTRVSATRSHQTDLDTDGCYRRKAWSIAKRKETRPIARGRGFGGRVHGGSRAVHDFWSSVVHSEAGCARVNGGNRFAWISIIVIKHAASMNYLSVGRVGARTTEIHRWRDGDGKSRNEEQEL